MYVATCELAAPMASCLRDPACGWCYDHALEPWQCLPCAAGAFGAPACALGPEPPRLCRDWTHAAPQPLLSSEGGGRAAISGEARAGRMAYFVLRSPHAHALLRVGFQPLNQASRARAHVHSRACTHTPPTHRVHGLANPCTRPSLALAPSPLVQRPPPPSALISAITPCRDLGQTNARLFAKRGAPPEADDYDATAREGEVLSLHATLPPAPPPVGRDAGTCLAGCSGGVGASGSGDGGGGDGGDGNGGGSGGGNGGGAVSGDNAWYIGVQGLDFFYEEHIYTSDPHGGPLPSPLPDGTGWLDYAPHGTCVG